MLWAIYRLRKSIKSTPQLGEMMNQRVVVSHFICFVSYLLSVLIYYIFYATWNDTHDTKHTNEFYATWMISGVLNGMCQGYLIYICWGLSADWVDFGGDESTEGRSTLVGETPDLENRQVIDSTEP